MSKDKHTGELLTVVEGDTCELYADDNSTILKCTYRSFQSLGRANTVGEYTWKFEAVEETDTGSVDPENVEIELKMRVFTHNNAVEYHSIAARLVEPHEDMEFEPYCSHLNILEREV